MKLSLREYDAMQSGWRKWINYAGLDFCFKFEKAKDLNDT